MNIRTLEQTPLAEITGTFNEAFSDYFIALQFTEAGMAAKIKSEGILPRYSVGAFEEGRMVGYILHGYDIVNGVKTIYNAGTGVIPAYRNKGITTTMYRYIIPLLMEQGIHHHVLEVIDNNYPAMKVYEKIGFRNVRSLVAFKSGSTIQADKIGDIKRLDEIPGEVRLFNDMESSWQNSLESVERDKEGHVLAGIYEGEKLLGFAAFVAATGRVKQYTVHPQHRRKGIGRALFQYMQQASGPGQLVVTNVDEDYKPAIAFLQALGFQRFLRLHEMRMVVE
jgi:ribosomal protein S18 acetylase RimI-like enzyme